MKGAEPFSAPHVIGVLRAKRARRGILFHIHAVNEGRANRQKYDKQRCRVAQGQSEPQETPSEQDQEWSTNADLRKPWKLLRGLVTGLLPYWCLEA